MDQRHATRMTPTKGMSDGEHDGYRTRVAKAHARLGRRPYSLRSSGDLKKAFSPMVVMRSEKKKKLMTSGPVHELMDPSPLNDGMSGMCG